MGAQNFSWPLRPDPSTVRYYTRQIEAALLKAQKEIGFKNISTIGDVERVLKKISSEYIPCELFSVSSLFAGMWQKALRQFKKELMKNLSKPVLKTGPRIGDICNIEELSLRIKKAIEKGISATEIADRAKVSVGKVYQLRSQTGYITTKITPATVRILQVLEGYGVETVTVWENGGKHEHKI